MTSPRRGALVPRLAAVVAVLATSVGLAVPARAASPVSAAPPALSAATTAALPAATTAALAAETPAAPGVTFALRPAGAKAIDARTTWTYRDVKPGQQWIDHLAVENYSNQAATFSVYAVDAYNGTSGGYELLRREDKQRGVGTWIELGTHTVTVPPRKAVLLPFRFHVPRRVEPGDHGGGIVATYRSTRTDTKGNAVTVESRVGTRMYVRIAGKLHPRLAVEKTSAAWLGAGFPRGSARVTWTVHNTGNVRLEGTQSVRIRGLLGKGVVASDVPDLTELLPGGSVTFSTRVDHVWPLLFHTATVVVDPRSVVGNVDPALEQASARIRFLSPLWLWIVLGVLLAGATWWYLARRRRRRRPAPGAPGAGASGPSSSTPVATAPDRVIVLPEDRSPARTLRTLGVAVLVALAGSVLPVGLGTAPAHAAGDELTFLPAKGSDTTPMYAVTSGPCPQATLGVIGRMYGAGLPADGTIVVPNTQAGIRTDTAFGVPLQDSLYGLATTLNVTFRGRYQVIVACIDELGTRTYAQFRGVLTFPTPHKVVGRAPARPPAYGVPVPYMTDTFPELKKLLAPSPAPSASAPGGLAPAASPQAVPSQRSGEAGGQAGGKAAAATPSPADGGSPLPFVAVGLALLAAAGGMWAWGRRPVPAPASVAWDDEPVGSPADDPADRADDPADRSATVEADREVHA